MKRSFILLSFFLCTFFCCRAQLTIDDGQAYVDSLTHILQTTSSDSIKAQMHYRLSNYWIYAPNHDTTPTLYHLEAAKQLSAKYPFLRAMYFFYIGQLYFNTDIPKSEAAYLKADSALSSFKTTEAYTFRALSWRNYGALEQRWKDEQTFANIVLNKAIPMAEKAGNKDFIAACYTDLGMSFANEEYFDKAAIYNDKAIAIWQSLPRVKQPARVIQGYIGSAACYIELEKFSLAKQRLDSAAAWMKRYPKADVGGKYHIREGMYYRKLKQYDKALASLRKGLELATRPGDKYDREGLLFQLHRLYADEGKYGAARDVLLNLVKNTANSMPKNRLLYREHLAQTYAQLGNMAEAYRWQKEYSRLSDSANTSRLKEKLNELEAHYQSAEKEKQINALQAKHKEAQLQLNNQRTLNWLLAAAAAFLLIVATLVWYNYRNAKKLNEKERALLLNRALLQGQEEERERLARDLHDGLGSMLARLGMQLSQASTPPDIDIARNQLAGSLKELRTIARDLSPVTLHRLGLEAALKELAESFITAQRTISFHAFDLQAHLPHATQTMIYRIVQELLNNAVRHGQPSHITLQCAQNETTFLITLEDNGKGFDPSIAYSGMGLNNIRKRVAYLHGTIDIISEPGKGTSVEIEVQV